MDGRNAPDEESTFSIGASAEARVSRVSTICKHRRPSDAHGDPRSGLV
jgi:hypothetical protein